ncbi:MAG: hypothetical protein AAF065_09500 [Verrucomicrobiota bacterium]
MKYKNILPCLLAALIIPAFVHAKPKKPGMSLAKIDSNGDEVISLEEAEDAGADKLVDNFNEIDTDGSSDLTKEELREHYKSRMEDRRAQRQSIDADGNGAISYDEAVDAGADKLVDNFERIDGNGDGELDREELQTLRKKMGQRRQSASDS